MYLFVFDIRNQWVQEAYRPKRLIEFSTVFLFLILKGD